MSYIFGSISLVLGIILSFVHIPASASVGTTGGLSKDINNQPNACILGFKCESPGCNPDPESSWSAPEGYQICMIVIKAGTHYFDFTSDGCVDNSPPPGGDGEPDYCAYGIGTGEGSAARLCEENGQTDCHAISHSEYYIDFLPPTSTPTETVVPPSPTPTETDVPPSPTPTETSLPPSPTPTETSVPPSLTPTGTMISPSETPTATPTGTPVVDTATPTPTQTELPPGTASPTPTSTSIAPTSTPTILGTMTTPTSTQPSSVTQTSTPTSSGEQVTPTISQATLPPPQITGTQPAILIPVTGVDFSSPFAQLEQTRHTLVNLGLVLLGSGLIFQGIGKKFEVIS